MASEAPRNNEHVAPHDEIFPTNHPVMCTLYLKILNSFTNQKRTIPGFTDPVDVGNELIDAIDCLNTGKKLKQEQREQTIALVTELTRVEEHKWMTPLLRLVNGYVTENDSAPYEMRADETKVAIGDAMVLMAGRILAQEEYISDTAYQGPLYDLARQIHSHPGATIEQEKITAVYEIPQNLFNYPELHKTYYPKLAQEMYEINTCCSSPIELFGFDTSSYSPRKLALVLYISQMSQVNIIYAIYDAWQKSGYPQLNLQENSRIMKLTSDLEIRQKDTGEGIILYEAVRANKKGFIRFTMQAKSTENMEGSNLQLFTDYIKDFDETFSDIDDVIDVTFHPSDSKLGQFAAVSLRHGDLKKNTLPRRSDEFNVFPSDHAVLEHINTYISTTYQEHEAQMLKEGLAYIVHMKPLEANRMKEIIEMCQTKDNDKLLNFLFEYLPSLQEISQLDTNSPVLLCPLRTSDHEKQQYALSLRKELFQAALSVMGIYPSVRTNILDRLQKESRDGMSISDIDDAVYTRLLKEARQLQDLLFNRAKLRDLGMNVEYFSKMSIADFLNAASTEFTRVHRGFWRWTGALTDSGANGVPIGKDIETTLANSDNAQKRLWFGFLPPIIANHLEGDGIRRLGRKSGQRVTVYTTHRVPLTGFTDYIHDTDPQILNTSNELKKALEEHNVSMTDALWAVYDMYTRGGLSDKHGLEQFIPEKGLTRIRNGYVENIRFVHGKLVKFSEKIYLSPDTPKRQIEVAKSLYSSIDKFLSSRMSRVITHQRENGPIVSEIQFKTRIKSNGAPEEIVCVGAYPRRRWNGILPLRWKELSQETEDKLDKELKNELLRGMIELGVFMEERGNTRVLSKFQDHIRADIAGEDNCQPNPVSYEDVLAEEQSRLTSARSEIESSNNPISTLRTICEQIRRQYPQDPRVGRLVTEGFNYAMQLHELRLNLHYQF